MRLAARLEGGRGLVLGDGHLLRPHPAGARRSGPGPTRRRSGTGGNRAAAAGAPPGRRSGHSVLRVFLEPAARQPRQVDRKWPGGDGDHHQSLPVTLWIIAVTRHHRSVMAVPLALYVAMTRHSSVPYIFRATTSVFLAIPAFFTALIGLIVFGLHYGIAPIIGYEPAFPANLKYLWLPALVICTTSCRFSRGSSTARSWKPWVRNSSRPASSGARPSALLLVLFAQAVAGANGRAIQLHGRRHDRLDGHHRDNLLVPRHRAKPGWRSHRPRLSRRPGYRSGLRPLVVVVGLIGDIFANWLDPRVSIS